MPSASDHISLAERSILGLLSWRPGAMSGRQMADVDAAADATAIAMATPQPIKIPLSASGAHWQQCIRTNFYIQEYYCFCLWQDSRSPGLTLDVAKFSGACAAG